MVARVLFIWLTSWANTIPPAPRARPYGSSGIQASVDPWWRPPGSPLPYTNRALTRIGYGPGLPPPWKLPRAGSRNIKHDLVTREPGLQAIK